MPPSLLFMSDGEKSSGDGTPLLLQLERRELTRIISEKSRQKSVLAKLCCRLMPLASVVPLVSSPVVGVLGDSEGCAMLPAAIARSNIGENRGVSSWRRSLQQTVGEDSKERVGRPSTPSEGLEYQSSGFSKTATSGSWGSGLL